MARNVHMCTSQGSSLISTGRSCHRGEFRRRCAQVVPTFTGTSGVKQMNGDKPASTERSRGRRHVQQGAQVVVMTTWRPPLGTHLGFEVRDVKRRDPEGPRALGAPVIQDQMKEKVRFDLITCWRVSLKDDTSRSAVWCLRGPTLSRLSWNGVTVGFRLQGRDFLVTQRLTFQTTQASSGHLHPLWALIPTKACRRWELP